MFGHVYILLYGKLSVVKVTQNFWCIERFGIAHAVYVCVRMHVVYTLCSSYVCEYACTCALSLNTNRVLLLICRLAEEHFGAIDRDICIYI